MAGYLVMLFLGMWAGATLTAIGANKNRRAAVGAAYAAGQNDTLAQVLADRRDEVRDAQKRLDIAGADNMSAAMIPPHTK